ncbi:MAG: DUF1844 domain-containing protein [Armatimonadetes bacterium]|nr:DUF1844 domain-containing protein [Armatimonadota bacterium]MDW8122153.1 DUF1844 domain-containing protein [Armatimonadota bacterium]
MKDSQWEFTQDSGRNKEEQNATQREEPKEIHEGEEREGAPADPKDFILFAISALTELAWMRMGLHIDPVKKDIVRDLEQARLAIDAVGALTDLITGRVDRATADNLRTSLTNLRLNFARQAQKREEGEQRERYTC